MTDLFFWVQVISNLATAGGFFVLAYQTRLTEIIRLLKSEDYSSNLIVFIT
jgi:hypothetical protein